MPAAVLFDLDGTLVDSLDDIADALNHVLRAEGHPTHPRAAIAAFVGDGAASLVARASPPGADREHLLRRFGEHYAGACLRRTRPYAGITTLLHELRAAGHRLAVLSNKPDALTRRVVEGCFAAGAFDLVAGDRPGVPRKPDPTAALAIAEALGVAPPRCWFVGDSPADVQTATAAGMRAVAVTWGLRAREDLRATGPDHLVDDVAALAGLLREPASG